MVAIFQVPMKLVRGLASSGPKLLGIKRNLVVRVLRHFDAFQDAGDAEAHGAQIDSMMSGVAFDVPERHRVVVVDQRRPVRLRRDEDWIVWLSSDARMNSYFESVT